MKRKNSTTLTSIFTIKNQNFCFQNFASFTQKLIKILWNPFHPLNPLTLLFPFQTCIIYNNFSRSYLPHFVMIISVPILWNSDHKSAFCNFTSALGSVKRGGIGGSWRVGKIDEYGSENWNQNIYIKSCFKTAKNRLKYQFSIEKMSAHVFRFERETAKIWNVA